MNTAKARSVDDTHSDHDAIMKDFKRAVNMSPVEIEKWLETADSKKVGWPKDHGDSESVGHKSGHRIIEITRKSNSKLDDNDFAHMRKVIGYVHRHLAQKPHGDIEHSNWRFSLMNWGHDPLK